MKTLSTLLSLLLVLVLAFYSFYGLMPKYDEDKDMAATEFSVDRALTPLEQIAKAPHYLGSEAHEDVRKFLVNELRKLGLEPHLQEGFSLNPVSKTLNKPINIAARIKGSENGKALLLLSHYDSAPVPSYGASDDGVGLVTILESVRAFLASNPQPKNDIIILFTDAEELGLDGAKLFVNEHPWAKDVGLVLNFEARGTSGPSNMIVETNGGNSNLIKGFIQANPEFPVASSLMYSVYKMLPNDTDSTIFREDGDIDGFFFAFIDSHFNYHTANDSMYFLDWNSLMHQGSYLLPLLHHFANTDLATVKSDTDDVYFNFPILKMVHYPFAWVWPMIILAGVVFIFLIIYGFYKKRLRGGAIGRGFLPLLLSLFVSGLLTLLGWKLLLIMYPQYVDIQQGFTYNGHWYIAFFVCLTLAFTWFFYKRFIRNQEEASFYVAPLFFWIAINIAVAVVIKGAAFFIVPVFFGLLSFFVMLRQQGPNLLAMTLLAIPAIFIFVPLIQFFPVGLGLKMLYVSSIFTVLLFGLMLPVFSYYKFKGVFSGICLLLAITFFIVAHSKSDYTVERKKPNSLVYYADGDAEKNYWLTYDREIDQWTENYLGENPRRAEEYLEGASYSKYGINYTFAAEAPYKDIPSFEIVLQQDTIIDEVRNVQFSIVPRRVVNKIDLYSTEDISFKSLEFNGKEANVKADSKDYRGTKNSALINYLVSKGDSLNVKFTIEKDLPVSFKVMEYSFDLMTHPDFNMEQRADYMMPKPFVITDAIAVKRSFSVDSLRVKESQLFNNQ